MKRCVIYTRVSTKEQAEGYSIAAQKKACALLAAERGWDVAWEFSDRGESARTADRPEFQRMLQLIANDGTISFLVVHKLDRVARNLEDHTMVRALLRQAKCELISVSENLERNASGRLVEGVLAVLAEFYSTNLSQEVKKGMEHKVRVEGGWPALAPIGYKNIRIEGVGRRGEAIIVPDAETSPLVLKAFQLYATGMWPLNRLCDELYRLGLRNRSGGRFARSKIAKMLKDPVYIGKTRWGEEVLPGRHDPLVDEDLFERVQTVIAEHDTAGVRRRKHDHYLRGTVFCQCEARLSTLTAKGRFEYFYCLGAHNYRTKCKQPYTPARSLERQVEGLYKTIAIPSSLRAEIHARLEKQIANRESRRAKEAKRWTRKLEVLAAKREKLLNGLLDELVEEDEYKEKKAELDAEWKTAEAALVKAGDSLESAREVIDVALHLIDNCYRAYKKASPEYRRRWNQALFEAIHVKDREIADATYREPFRTLLGSGSGESSSSSDSLVGVRGIEPRTTTL